MTSRRDSMRRMSESQLPQVYGLDEAADALLEPRRSLPEGALRCACLGLGVGGFELAARALGLEVVNAGPPSNEGHWSSPVVASELPDHEVLIAGVPEMGDDALEEVMRVVRVKRPLCVVIDSPHVLDAALRKSIEAVADLGYSADGASLRHEDFGAPGGGMRNVVVATACGGEAFQWPTAGLSVAQEPDQAEGSMSAALIAAAVNAMTGAARGA